MQGDHTRLYAKLQSLIETYRCDVQADSSVHQADPVFDSISIVLYTVGPVIIEFR